jgi:diadenosine tetraphosphate (Ap4A) HIT family hydrolase
MSPATCPFCTVDPDRTIAAAPLAFAIRDGFPISPGHTLIIPRRHVGSWFEATAEEREAIATLLDACKSLLDREFRPAAYNIGVNDGPAAGQTVPHLHVHLIPRYPGDLPDPRGGVRWVLPGKAKYWPD